VAAIEKACREVIHLFSGMLAPPVVLLARELARMLPPALQKVLLLSTGGESNEAALRLAKLKTGGFEVLGFTGSWHGMTAGASSSTYSAGHKGYGPAMPGTMVLPAPNCYRCPIRHCQDRCDMTCLEVGVGLADSQSVGAYAAVIAEPVLSVGGIVPLPKGYLARLKRVCEERGMLLILDEAQTALGRVGANFAFEAEGVVPDVLTLSKTLGGGLPLSATVTSAAIEEECYEKGFLHFTSHVSDPLPAEVGLAMLRVLAEERLAERARLMGDRLRSALLLGVELVKDREGRAPDEELGARVTRRCLELGLNMNIVKFKGLGNVFRLAPPLTVTTDEIDEGISIIDQALTESRR
jgi:2,2-dialkylglycine decarboxylase (pyruvate)